MAKHGSKNYKWSVKNEDTFNRFNNGRHFQTNMELLKQQHPNMFD